MFFLYMRYVSNACILQDQIWPQSRAAGPKKLNYTAFGMTAGAAVVAWLQNHATAWFMMFLPRRSLPPLSSCMLRCPRVAVSFRAPWGFFYSITISLFTQARIPLIEKCYLTLAKETYISLSTTATEHSFSGERIHVFDVPLAIPMGIVQCYLAN